MKKLLFFIGMFPTLMFSQNDISFVSDFGVGYSDFISIEEHSDRLYSVVRFFDFDSIQAMKIIKTDTSGSLLKELLLKDSSSLFSTYQDFAGFKITKEGKILFWGTKFNVPRPGISYLILTDTSLNSYQIKEFVLDKPYPEYRTFGATSMLVTSDAYYLLGVVQFEDYTQDALVIKTDLDGNELWRREYGWDNYIEKAQCITMLSENEIVIGGQRIEEWTGGDSRNWIFAIDSMGNQLWNWESPLSPMALGVVSIHGFHDNLVFTSGYGLYNQQGLFVVEGYEASLNSNHQIKWRNLLPYPTLNLYTAPYNATLSSDSISLISVGKENYAGPGYVNHTCLTSGLNLSHTTIDVPHDSVILNSGEVFLYDITSLSSGSTVACGSAAVETATGFGTRAWLIKVSASGIPDTLYCGAFVPASEPSYTGIELSIFPNPSIDQVEIKLPKLPKGARLRCFSLQGQLKKELLLSEASPKLDVSEWASGMYIVQVLGADGGLLGVGRFVRL